MKYTYRTSIQGHVGDKYYAYIDFDRQIFNAHHYRDGQTATPEQQKILDAVSKTPGVIHSEGGEQQRCGLILIAGNQIIAQINPHTNIPLTVSGIVKKIQRRIAKGEGRQRVLKKTLDAVTLARNKRTYGEA